MSSTAAKWSSEWCITESFFTITAPTEVDGKTVVNLLGWDEWNLMTIETGGFTDWIDVKIYISLDSATDKITLLYYIEGVYVTSCTKKLTTQSNSIDSICISGSTSAQGSGIMIDDIGFGYTPNGIWVPGEE